MSLYPSEAFLTSGILFCSCSNKLPHDLNPEMSSGLNCLCDHMPQGVVFDFAQVQYMTSEKEESIFSNKSVHVHIIELVGAWSVVYWAASVLRAPWEPAQPEN